jgi:hypothetical protein
MSPDMSRRLLLKAGGSVAVGAVAGLGPAPGRVTASGEAFAGRFSSPAGHLYPAVHWLLPLAATTTEAQIAAEVEAMAGAGIRSAELFPWVVPGADLATHGWGTAAWNDRVRAALAAARRHGVTIDLVIAPETPAGVPSITVDSPGAAKELVYGHAAVAGGSTFDGAVPPPREFDISDPYGRPDRQPSTPTLVAVTAARLATTRSRDTRTVLLDPTSLVDLTRSVAGGRITWTAPDTGHWLLFGFWQRGTGQLADGTSAPMPVIDYYSEAGVDAVTRFWDEYLLPPSIRGLVRDTGGSIHEDAIETQFVLPWTTGMLERFGELRGFSLAPYLPVLFIERLHVYAEGSTTPEDPPDFDLADGRGFRVRNDYYQTLTDLYREHHLAGISRWARRHGLRHSAKLGPGPVLDTQAAAVRLDVPEREQVYFFDGELDGYRTLAGAVHMGHKPGYASIAAPVTGEPFQDAYGVTWRRMLDIIHQNYAGGATRATLHYFPHADAPGAAWPGWAAFAPLRLGPDQSLPGLAEAWGPRQPTWRHLPDITGYLARQQLVLRAGRPRVDVAVYRHGYWEPSAAPNPIWGDPGLRRAGYTYDFVGPALLDLPTARVAGHRLDPDGSAYRALILDDQHTLPLRTARKILDHARAGLPVVVVAAPPSHTPSFAGATTQDRSLRRVVARLLARPNVARVATEADVPAALAGLGVTPAAAFAAPADLLTVHRTDGPTDYHWCFNSGGRPVDLDVAFEGGGQPYTLDAWTGAITPITRYVRQRGRTTVRLRLAAKQTAIIALATRSLPGARSAVPVKRLAPLRLASWRLSVDDWRPGATATRTAIVRHELDLTELKPWSQIPELADSCGIGRYITSVTLPALDGAYLDLGEVFGTVRVTVNGRPLPPIDQTRPVADLRDRLVAGTNTIQVEVATTLRNRLRLLDPSQAAMARQDYGLTGPVVLIPYADRPG